jgi:hypothetical protein
MNTSLLLGGIWVLVAAAIAMLPQRTHWPGAVALIVTGIPLLGYITYQNGAVVGVIALAAGASVLRWPLFYLGRWLRGKVGRRL